MKEQKKIEVGDRVHLFAVYPKREDWIDRGSGIVTTIRGGILFVDRDEGRFLAALTHPVLYTTIAILEDELSEARV